MKDSAKKQRGPAAPSSKSEEARPGAKAQARESAEKGKAAVAESTPDEALLSAAYARGVSDCAAFYNPMGFAGPADRRGGGTYAPEFEQSLVEFGARLSALMQGRFDLGAVKECAESLESKSREDYLRTWKEYLRNRLAASKGLAVSIDTLLQTVQPGCR